MRDTTRNYIDAAHVQYEKLRKARRASGAASGAEDANRFDEIAVELLHKLIHAVDLVEKRLDAAESRARPRLSLVITPAMKRQAERLRGAFERGRARTRVIQHNLREALNDRVRSLKSAGTCGSAPPAEIETEVAELKGEIRSIRETMEALARRLEEGPLRTG